jgi:hypothetical protein
MKFRIYLILLCIVICLTDTGNNENFKLDKFKVFNSKIDKMGTEKPSDFKYKKLYTFKDRLVIMTSDNPETRNPDLEREMNIQETEERIERIINFSDIMLNCGGFNNKLCLVKDFPGIEKISYSAIKAGTKYCESSCLIIPFYDNLTTDINKKVVYICAGSNVHDDILKFLTFKNELSRDIDAYQLQVFSDGNSSSNGQLRTEEKFVTVVNNIQENVTAKIYNTAILMTNQDWKLLKSYSLFQQRLVENDIYTIAGAKEKGILTDEWIRVFQNGSPISDCCLYLKGEIENLPLCLGNGSGFEADATTCSKRLGNFIDQVNIGLKKIKFMDSYGIISRNINKPVNCESTEYQVMKSRAEKTLDNAMKIDCKTIMVFSDAGNEVKTDSCFNIYQYDFTSEKDMMSLGNQLIFKHIQTCVDLKHAKSLTKEVFQATLVREGLQTPSVISFIEIDEYVNEDIIDTKKAFTPRFKQDQSVNKSEDFRKALILDLQNSKLSSPATTESMNESFTKASIKGNEFVSFLGFIGDKSLKAGRTIRDNDEKKLYNLLHNIK